MYLYNLYKCILRVFKHTQKCEVKSDIQSSVIIYFTLLLLEPSSDSISFCWVTLTFYDSYNTPSCSSMLWLNSCCPWFWLWLCEVNRVMDLVIAVAVWVSRTGNISFLHESLGWCEVGSYQLSTFKLLSLPPPSIGSLIQFPLQFCTNCSRFFQNVRSNQRRGNDSIMNWTETMNQWDNFKFKHANGQCVDQIQARSLLILYIH